MGQESRFCKSLWGLLSVHIEGQRSKAPEAGPVVVTQLVSGHSPMTRLVSPSFRRTWDRRRGSTLHHDCLSFLSSLLSSFSPLFPLSPYSLSSFPTPLTVVCVCACVCLHTLSPVCAHVEARSRYLLASMSLHLAL